MLLREDRYELCQFSRRYYVQVRRPHIAKFTCLAAEQLEKGILEPVHSVNVKT